MKRLFLLAALLPASAAAQTLRLEAGPPVDLSAPGVEAELADLAKYNFNDFVMFDGFSQVDNSEWFHVQLKTVEGVARDEGAKPARREAAKALLWAVSRERPYEGHPILRSVGRFSLERAPKDEKAREELVQLRESFSSKALAVVEPAAPPALAPAAPKLRAMIMMSYPDAGAWEQGRNIHQRGAEAVEDRDSELASYYPGTTSNLPILTEWALGRALDRVKGRKSKPLVASEILHAASQGLDEPRKAQLLLRFMDANLHPDFRGIVSENQRRATVTAVEALFSSLGWGSAPVEQAVLRHLRARVADEPAPLAAAASTRALGKPSGSARAGTPLRALLLGGAGGAVGILGWQVLGWWLAPLYVVLLGLGLWRRRERPKSPEPPEISEGLDEIERYLRAHDVEERIRILEEKGSVAPLETELVEEAEAPLSERLTPPRKVR